VTYVELDPLLIEAARAYLPAPDAAVLDDKRVTLVLSDGRLYVKQRSKLIEKQDIPGQINKTASHVLDEASQPYDVIILDLPEPSTGALNRFYTREFFAEVKAILNSGGIFALGLPSAENYWSLELAQRNGSIYYTLRTTFPEALVLPGEHNFLLASDTTLEADPNTLTERLERRNVETRWVTPDYIEYVFTTDRFAEVRRQLEAMTDVRLNRDLTPICYYYDLVLWFSRFYPDLAGVLQAARVGQDTDPTMFIWIAAPLALGVILIRWQRRLVVPIAVAGIGLAGMTLQLVLLFTFQVLHGYVYAEVSLMITAYMAGLALGAACGNHLLATWSVTPERRAKQALLGLQLAIAIYSGIFMLLLHLTIPMPRLVFPLLALLAGGLGGMAFPLALALIPKKGNAGRAAGMLYGADLVGGCLGALAGAVFLIPVLGIPQTCAVLALITLAGLLVLV
jgi:spermidine synthase